RVGLALDLQVLDDRFDNDVRLRDLFKLRGPAEARHRGVFLLGRDRSFFGEFGERLLYAAQTFFNQIVAYFDDRYLITARRRDLRDAASHQPRAQNSDFLY